MNNDFEITDDSTLEEFARYVEHLKLTPSQYACEFTITLKPFPKSILECFDLPLKAE